MAWSSHLMVLLSLFVSYYVQIGSAARYKWPVGGSTRFYDFKVQTKRITKLCRTRDIVTINGMYPGPVVYAQEDDRVIVMVTNETPYNTTIHWHGVQQRLTCWSDGPAYVTQCPIQAGQSFTYEFTLVQQKGTLFWHAHISWLRGTVHGAIVIYPKTGVPYPFPNPYEEHVLILGEYWHHNLLKLEKRILATGEGAPPADAYTINGHPGPLYNCSENDVYKIDAVPGKTYLLRIVNAALNTELFFAIANHQLTVVEADGDYTKPFTAEQLMITPGQTVNVLVEANQPIAKYSMAVGPYVSGQGVPFQSVSAVARFQYSGAGRLTSSLALPAPLPVVNDNLAAKNAMDGLRSLNATDLPLEIDTRLLFTIGLNVEACHSPTPNESCRGPNGGTFAASMNNVTFVIPSIPLLQAYHDSLPGHIYTDDFPRAPLKAYDFVNGAPNNVPDDTQSSNGTRVSVLEYGARVQLVLQDTGTVSTDNHPMHLHGYSFYVVGYGTGNYNATTAKLNLVDPPYMNTIGVPAGGWAAIRFTADNPGVWFMHCHLDIHTSWGLSMAFIVKNGKGSLETLPHPPADLPRC